MRRRRGVALLAALWLIVAIAAVAVQFELVARERRVLGLAAADRGRERAAAAGALATIYGRLDTDLRNAGTAARASVAGLRASDPWLDVDSLYSGIYYIDSVPVQVIARDLGNTVNINSLPEEQLRTLFSFVLGDYRLADQLAQAIMDWRDTDDNPRTNGAERDDYVKENMLALPANAQFREVDDLAHVYGMTPEVLEMLRPYMTTHGANARVNLNTAPEPVLRALPGMSDALLVQILAGRSQGRRIESVAQVVGNAARGAAGRGGGQNPAQEAQARAIQQLTSRTTVNTTDVELTFLVNPDAKVQPTRLIAIVNRTSNTAASIQWQLW